MRKFVDKQTAYLEFKRDGDGLQLEESIKDNRTELKNMKNEMKKITEECNTAMKDINVVKVELDRK